MPKKVTFAELKLIDWVKGKSGSFWGGFFDLLSCADEANLVRMGEGFPEEVRVFQRYRNERGYWDELQVRYQRSMEE